MMKVLLPASLSALSLLAVAETAEAQVPGRKGDFVIGAERLFGIRSEHVEVDAPAPLGEFSRDATTISFGLANTGVPANIPRLGFDYLLTDHLSLGGSLGFSTSDTDNDSAYLGGFVGFGDNTKTFVIAPRVGYLYMFGAVAGIWPRAGFSYESTTVRNGPDASDLALNLECNFPIVIAPHFGVLLGLTFDQTLTGEIDPGPNEPDVDWGYRSVALQVGLFGWI
jgi:hypothetical protein